MNRARTSFSFSFSSPSFLPPLSFNSFNFLRGKTAASFTSIQFSLRYSTRFMMSSLTLFDTFSLAFSSRSKIVCPLHPSYFSSSSSIFFPIFSSSRTASPSSSCCTNCGMLQP
ncbi:hypothetical protein PENTCL1PPCAC_7166 [Pristionchus entomophagus]|uniref:Uncharacterized protein n=1 Tax=Pristionchus entomophagus TaxID=358040 RepID=A0AAV5SP57_9BILA|nr:hypothetical protein PENTCL1PPCAC_7166 [Pristionchus entomophagus]